MYSLQFVQAVWAGAIPSSKLGPGVLGHGDHCLSRATYYFLPILNIDIITHNVHEYFLSPGMSVNADCRSRMLRPS